MNSLHSLVPVRLGAIGGTFVPATSGRALHAFLENRDHVATWIKDRIEQYGFVENQDFTTYSEVSEKGGRPATEYAITLDMAKELAMEERNHKGKEARQYFIDCERRAKQGQPALNPANLSRLQLIEMAMQAEQERLALETKVEEMAPKVAVHDRIADAEGSITIREAANTLRFPERKFVQWLLMNDWCYRRAGHKSLLAYADKVKAGYLYLKQTPIQDVHTGEERLSEQVRITPLGLTALARRLSREGRQTGAPAGLLVEVPTSYREARG